MKTRLDEHNTQKLAHLIQTKLRPRCGDGWHEGHVAAFVKTADVLAR